MTDVPYRVLARKYRPLTFADLVGQEAMVRILTNAFRVDRIAQAFILTGIRGTGKTTTARIIAKGLNCVGPDGTGGPTTAPCGVCEPCVAIAEGRHVDVQEMDAASNTGVQNIRDAIIDTVAYRAATARYKVFIIDEVHMLSTSAFNALLKTLEEPPAHVKFIFATTEIRKVPVTVLSRCQRFDLRRIEPEAMIALLARIAAAEGAEIEPAALALITRAAEGSARDATSLLDQAIAQGAGHTTAADVRAMLGLADRGRVLDLFERIMAGDARAALEELAAQYADGADPVAVLRDLAEVTHWVSLIKIAPEAADDATAGPDARARGLDLAGRLPIRALTRMWQMLLKALEEVAGAPNAIMAAEMAVIRLTHVADLPSPEEIVRRLGSAPPTTPAERAPVAVAAPRPTPAPRGGPAVARIAEPEPLPAPPGLATFDDLVARIRDERDMTLLLAVEAHVRLVRMSPGRIEFEPAGDAPPDLAPRLARRLMDWTGTRWTVSLVSAGGGATLREAAHATRSTREAEALRNPIVAAVLSAFPGSVIAEIREAVPAAVPVAEDWDPVEDG